MSQVENGCDRRLLNWAQQILKEPNQCRRFSHLALQPAVSARPMGGFEQSLAQASLRRVEAKEFLFAEGDPSTHLFCVETGALALHKS